MPCVSACLHLFLFLHVCLSPTKPTFPTFPYLYKASRDEIRTYLCFLCTHSLVHPRAWVSRLAPPLGQTPSVLLLGLILPPLNPSAPPHCFQGTPPRPSPQAPWTGEGVGKPVSGASQDPAPALRPLPEGQSHHPPVPKTGSGYTGPLPSSSDFLPPDFSPASPPTLL